MMISKAKAFRNIIYTGLNKATTLICIAVASSIVARNLSPSDYGVVGFAGIIIGFLSHFGDIGVGNAAIRSSDLDDRGLHTAFTLKIILSIGAFIAAFLVAPFARHIFAHHEIANVIRVLALDFLISTIGFMSLVVLTREQNYRALIIPGFASAAFRSVLTIILVLHGWKYWAVVFADIGSNLVSCIAIQATRAVPIRLRFDWKDARGFLRFGMPLLGSGILIFFVLNMDNFLIGSKLGSTELGYYALAFTWGTFICGILEDTVSNVMFPTFSAIQDNTLKIRRWYLKTVDLVVFVAVIVNTALFANVQFFLVTFLGKGTTKWLPAAVPLKILCVYGILRAATVPIGNCIMARGQTRILLYANALIGVVELFLILQALRTSRIDLVAVAIFVSYACASIVLLPYLRREFSIGFTELFSQIWPAIPSLIMGCLFTSLLPNSFGATLLTLGVRGGFTAFVVALTHGLCTRFRCFQEAGSMISQSLARVRV